jgi:RHS repeat-associated protein
MVLHSSGSADAVQYLQKDNLGSVIGVTDANGALIQSYVYDTVGKRTTTFTASGYSGILTDLGYTGHIQLDALNLVHMKGRVYDPIIGRFISPDPTIQSPLDLQSFNRYSYASNNPLTFIDPSGFDECPPGSDPNVSCYDPTLDSTGNCVGCEAGSGNNTVVVTAPLNPETSDYSATPLPGSEIDGFGSYSFGGDASGLYGGVPSAVGGGGGGIRGATSPAAAPVGVSGTGGGTIDVAISNGNFANGLKPYVPLPGSGYQGKSCGACGSGLLPYGAQYMARDSSPVGPWDVIALATLAVPGLGEVGVVGEIASEARVAKYEVGAFNVLKGRSIVGDGLDIHHVLQSSPASQVIQGYDRLTAPSIAIPQAEHRLIPTITGEFSGSARDLMAKDILNLRNYTNTPNNSLQDLIDLNKQMYPEVFTK